MTVTAVDISVGFCGEPVLFDVTPEFLPSETVALVGPSSTGKRTLLRLFAAFRRPDDGTVHWGGDDVWALSDAERLAVRRWISMVFQELSLFNEPVACNLTSSHG